MSQKISWWCKSRRAQTKDDYETWLEGGVVPTLNAFDNGDTRATVLIVENNRRDGARLYEYIMPTLQGFMGTGGGNVPMVNKESIVRRLTPTETERLQGFPDGWTDGQADSNRYKQMGNAVAVPVVSWIIRNMSAIV